MVVRAQLIRDILYFIKNDFQSNITDPISTTRKSVSAFIMTSYPQRPVDYPLITLKIPNIEAKRSGMQSTQLDIIVPVEIRVWARNEREKDTISQQVIDRLANFQHIASGSVDNDIHDFQVLSSTEVDEEGEGGTKSRVIVIQYKFFG